MILKNNLTLVRHENVPNHRLKLPAHLGSIVSARN
jgi:hypothetical protein